MEDRLLLRIALIGSLIGIALLFIFSLTIQLEPGQLEDKKPGDKARLEGRILSVQHKGQTTFMDITHECSTKAVLFEEVDVQEGSAVNILGTLQEYNGQKEIVVDEIIIR